MATAYLGRNAHITRIYLEIHVFNSMWFSDKVQLLQTR